MRSTWRRSLSQQLLGLTLAGALVSGCSGTSSSSGVADPSPATREAIIPSATHDPADQTSAEAIVLQPADLKGLFAASPFTVGAASTADEQQLASCLNRPEPSQVSTGRAFSRAFSRGDAEKVNAGTTVVDSSETARADLAAFASESGPRCLAALLTSQATRRKASAPRMRASSVPFPVTGAQGTGIRLLSTVKDDKGQDLTMVTDYFAAIDGRIEVDATFQNVNAGVSVEVQRKVMTAMLSRAGRAAQAG